MEDRLQKIISACGIMSRRAAETCIAEGRVAVNGVTAVLGSKADPERDEICIDGKPIAREAENEYIMLYKPRGYVTTMHDEQNRKCVVQLVEELGVRVYPVGRLDLNSEGLLVMTNDGDFAQKLMHPSHEVTKTYRTTVEGSDLSRAMVTLQQPLLIEGYRVRPAQVVLVKETASGAILDITIHEGRNRQVRKMCELAGLRVIRLCRIQEGSLKLGNLKPGQWRRLTRTELKELTGAEG